MLRIAQKYYIMLHFSLTQMIKHYIKKILGRKTKSHYIKDKDIIYSSKRSREENIAFYEEFKENYMKYENSVIGLKNSTSNANTHCLKQNNIKSAQYNIATK